MFTPQNHSGRLAVARLLIGSFALMGPALVSPASAQMVPWGWSTADVGGPALSGGANFGPGSIAVSSGGTDIDDASDQFTLLYRTLSGDGTLIVHVAALQGADPLAQGGLMIRESLAPGSRHAAILATSSGTSFRSRAADGAPTGRAAELAGGAPVWLKLDRISNVFIASRSPDGVNWQFAGSATIPLSPSVFVGLAVASHKSGSAATAAVTDLAVIGNGALPPGWSGNDIGNPALPGGSTSGGMNFILDSAGTGINGGGDQFRYVYQQTTGDVDIVARVAGFDMATPAALAGVIIRQSLAGSSPHAAMLVSPGGGTVMRARSSTGALTTNVPAVGAAPVWVKVSRRGSILVTARSVDGSTWSTVGQQNVPMSDPVYVGMALTGADAGQRARATFDGVTITSPNKAPTVTLTTPASTMTLLAPASLTLTATASDPDGTIAQVDFIAGPNLLGSDTTSPYSFNWSNVTAGSYVIKAVARDNLGAYTSSVERAVTVSGDAPPTVTLTSPATLTFASSATIGLAATAADLDGTVARVEFYAGATLLASDVASPYAYSWVNPPNGTHVLKAVAYDNAGGRTNSVTRTITVGGAPVSPPTVSLTSPANGATVVPNANVTITASAADADGSVARVDFYAGNARIGSQTSAPYTIAWAVPTGSHVLKAVAFDDTGVSATSATRTITAQAPAIPPTVSLMSPANGTTVAPNANVTIAASAADADGSVARVDFYVGNARIGSQTSAPYTITWAVPAGSHVLKAVAFDDTGVSTTSATRTITAQAPASAPTVSLSSPADGESVAPRVRVTIAANAADADGSVARVDFYAGATLIGSDQSPPYHIRWRVPAGSHVLKAVAFDDTGASATSATRTIIAGEDVGEDASPTVTLTSPASGQSFTGPATVSLTATASDTDGTVSIVEFYVGTTLVASDTTPPYAFDWPNVAVGNYGIKAVARDNAGNMTVSSARDIVVVSGGLPNTVAFLPSVDHESVDRYVLEIFASGATPGVSLPVATKSLGRPPVVDGECTADVATTISPLPAGTYIATVSSENSLGFGRSQWTLFSR